MANGKDDLRLDLGWPKHPKTKKLKRVAGPHAPLALLSLWCFAAKHHWDGVLHGMSPEDIEEASDWEGKPGVLHAALVECRWIEKDGVTLHDWPAEQPWIFGKAERSVLARGLAKRRWDKVRNALIPDAKGTENGATRNASSNATRNATGNAPSPYPSPSPTEEESEKDAAALLGDSPPREQAQKDPPLPLGHEATCVDPLHCDAGYRNSQRTQAAWRARGERLTCGPTGWQRRTHS